MSEEPELVFVCVVSVALFSDKRKRCISSGNCCRALSRAKLFCRTVTQTEPPRKTGIRLGACRLRLMVSAQLLRRSLSDTDVSRESLVLSLGSGFNAAPRAGAEHHGKQNLPPSLAPPTRCTVQSSSLRPWTCKHLHLDLTTFGCVYTVTSSPLFFKFI